MIQKTKFLELCDFWKTDIAFDRKMENRLKSLKDIIKRAICTVMENLQCWLILKQCIVGLNRLLQYRYDRVIKEMIWFKKSEFRKIRSFVDFEKKYDRRYLELCDFWKIDLAFHRMVYLIEKWKIDWKIYMAFERAVDGWPKPIISKIDIIGK